MFNNRQCINAVTPTLKFDEVIDAECDMCSKHLPEISLPKH
jgi:hypothetical protein